MFNRILSLIFLMGLSATAHADTMQGIFGFNSGAVNFGAAYEHELDRGLGVGGYFYFASDEKDLTIPEVVSFGANTKLHLRALSDKVDVYVAPGFGIHMVDFKEASNVDETVFGPTMAIGALFQVTKKVAVGLENLRIYNWFSDEVGGPLNYMNATLVFEL